MATAFVILHHRTLDVSLSCLDNLLKASPDSPIVVVDNGSGDGSGEELRQRFADYKNVVVIINDQNLGFAKGNNIGYKYVKDNFDVDCVVVMNNDVIITQPNFEDIIANYMKYQHLDVCGPDVITPEGRHQNPLQREPFSTFRIIKWMLMDWIRLIMLKLHLFERKILATYTSVSNSYQRQDIDLNGITDCVLHGSCVAYSSDYFIKEDFAFVPVTFLYAEEMILADYCKRKNYRTGVCPTATVTHLGGKTIMNGALPREKQIFKTRQVVRSLWQLLKARFFNK